MRNSQKRQIDPYHSASQDQNCQGDGGQRTRVHPVSFFGPQNMLKYHAEGVSEWINKNKNSGHTDRKQLKKKAELLIFKVVIL